MRRNPDFGGRGTTRYGRVALYVAGGYVAYKAAQGGLFGLPLQHSQAGISTEADLTTSKRPTPIFPMDYTCSFISSRTMPSFRTDSSSTSPSSDSDCGMEMQTMETQPSQSLKVVEKINVSSLRHRTKDKGQSGGSV